MSSVSAHFSSGVSTLDKESDSVAIVVPAAPLLSPCDGSEQKSPRSQFLEDVANALAERWHRSEDLVHLAVECRDHGLLTALAQSGLISISSPSSVPIGESERDATALSKGTALHRAVRNNDLTSVRILVECGADRNAFDSEGFTPLACAVMLNLTECVEVLLELDMGLVHAVNAGGNTVFHLAVLGLAPEDGSDPWAVHLLRRIMAHLDPSALARSLARYNCDGHTAATLAAERCVWNAVEMILHACPETAVLPNRRTRRTLLHYASSAGHLEATTTLLTFDDGHIAVNARDVEGRTALHCAVQPRDIAVIRALICFGACVDVRDSSGFSCLDVAIRTGDTAMVQVMLVDASAFHDSGACVSSAGRLAPIPAIRSLLHRFSTQVVVTNPFSIARGCCADSVVEAGEVVWRASVDGNGETDAVVSALSTISKCNHSSLYAMALRFACVALDVETALNLAFQAVSCDPYDPRSYDVVSRLLAARGCDTLAAEFAAVRDELLGTLHESNSVVMSPRGRPCPPLNELDLDSHLAGQTKQLVGAVEDANGDIVRQVLMPGGVTMWVILPPGCDLTETFDGDNDSHSGVGVLKGPIASGYPVPAGSLISYSKGRFVEVITTNGDVPLLGSASLSMFTLRCVRGCRVAARGYFHPERDMSQWDPFDHSNANRAHTSRLLTSCYGEDVWVLVDHSGDELPPPSEDFFWGIVFYNPIHTTEVRKGDRVMVSTQKSTLLYV